MHGTDYCLNKERHFTTSILVQTAYCKRKYKNNTEAIGGDDNIRSTNALDTAWQDIV